MQTTSRSNRPVSVGSIARKLLGANFHRFGKLYCSIFGDLGALADIVSAAVPDGSTLLDVGAGDGQPMNYLLKIRSDIRVVGVDIAARIGGALEAGYADRVTLLPSTSLGAYDGRADVILISDVLHHIPSRDRSKFFEELRVTVARASVHTVIVKDLEPGHFRAVLGWLADRYISSDRNVEQISSYASSRLLAQALGHGFLIREAGLLVRDSPNYCLVANASS